MTNFYRVLSFALVLSSIALSQPVQAQGTWGQVYNILTTNCSGSGCHGAGSPDFNVTLSEADLYDQIINKTPLNPAAASKKYKLIEPGHPERSYILRKVSSHLGTFQSHDLVMEAAEGSNMPYDTRTLSKTQVETIRQWILYGSPETGTVIDTMILHEYYTIGGQPLIQRPNPPAEGEGFQIHLGPIFWNPLQEKEYFKKHELNLEEGLEITGFDLLMNTESHHYILRKYLPGTKDNFGSGLELLNPLTAFTSERDYVMAWQANEDFRLPNGTAYVWDSATAIDLNFHMKNPHSNILPGEVYMNVYTQPLGTKQVEMKSKLVNNAAIFLPPNQVTTLTAHDNMAGKSIWSLTSHAHQQCTDFKVYLTNAGSGNTYDSLVYDGKMNYLTGVNTGRFDYTHPPTRFFEPFLDLRMRDEVTNEVLYKGLTYKAEYNNATNNVITFGFTTVNEMMIIYVQYVDSTYVIPEDSTTDTTGIFNIAKQGPSINVYPNPFSSEARIDFTIAQSSNVVIELYDMIGQRVDVLANDPNMAAGSYGYLFQPTKALQNGIYFLRYTVDGVSTTKKLIFAGQ